MNDNKTLDLVNGKTKARGILLKMIGFSCTPCILLLKGKHLNISTQNKLNLLKHQDIYKPVLTHGVKKFRLLYLLLSWHSWGVIQRAVSKMNYEFAVHIYFIYFQCDEIPPEIQCCYCRSDWRWAKSLHSTAPVTEMTNEAAGPFETAPASQKRNKIKHTVRGCTSCTCSSDVWRTYKLVLTDNFLCRHCHHFLDKINTVLNILNKYILALWFLSFSLINYNITISSFASSNDSPLTVNLPFNTVIM